MQLAGDRTFVWIEPGSRLVRMTQLREPGVRDGGKAWLHLPRDKRRRSDLHKALRDLPASEGSGRSAQSRQALRKNGRDSQLKMLYIHCHNNPYQTTQRHQSPSRVQELKYTYQINDANRTTKPRHLCCLVNYQNGKGVCKDVYIRGSSFEVAIYQLALPRRY